MKVMESMALEGGLFDLLGTYAATALRISVLHARATERVV